MKIVVNDMIVELYTEFLRLKGYKLPKSPIEAMIDQSTGAEEAHMKEFAEWFRTEILDRLEPPTPEESVRSKEK